MSAINKLLITTSLWAGSTLTVFYLTYYKSHLSMDEFMFFQALNLFVNYIFSFIILFTLSIVLIKKNWNAGKIKKRYIFAATLLAIIFSVFPSMQIFQIIFFGDEFSIFGADQPSEIIPVGMQACLYYSNGIISFLINLIIVFVLIWLAWKTSKIFNRKFSNKNLSKSHHPPP